MSDLPVDTRGLVVLLLAALFAGWVDAVSGGGGLIQLPALLLVLPAVEPAALLGTNKVAAIVGTAAAAVTYIRRAPPDLRTAVPMAGAAFAGSAAGALVAASVPAGAYRPVVIVALIAVALWSLARPGFGRTESLRWAGRRRHVAIAVAFGALIGTYDGAVGPGTGSFLVAVLVALLGYSFLRASATAKIVNVGTNLAALVIFVPAGHVLWGVGALMAAANLTGGIVGARTAVARGSGFVRVVFLVVVAALLVSLLLPR